MVNLPRISNRGVLFSTLGTCVGLGFYIRDVLGGKKYTYKTDAARKKIFIITGATSGLGKATAKELAFRKAKVVLACRDMDECTKVCESLKVHSKNKNIKCMQLDLADQNSIREFAEAFNKQHKRLDVLINNAGVMAIPRRSTTEDGIETQLGVNHIGHFLLTQLLLPKLQESAPSRIVNVISIGYKKGKINKEDLNSIQKYEPEDAYYQSNLAEVICTKELAERLKGTGVTVNAVYPGVVNTKIMRHTSFYNSYFSAIFLKPLVWMFIKNPKQGSQPILYAAIDPEIQEETGVMFGHDFVKSELTLPDNVDTATSKWVWDVTMKWTRLLQ